MASWSDIQRGIFAGESGGDYNALFNYQNRPNGIFSDVRVSDMSIADVLQFADPRGEYGQYVASARPDPEMGVATPVGAYQVVGATLRDAVKALNLDPNQKFDKATQDKVGQWIYQTQGTGAWQGYKGPQSKPKDMNMSMNPNAPQRTGLLGFMDIMRRPDEATGMTAMERFGAALDPLLLPEQRMGEQIRARGAQRLDKQRRNKTMEWLKSQEGGEVYAQAIEMGVPIGDVYSAYLKAQTGDYVVVGKTLVDRKTGKPIFTAPSTAQSQGTIKLSDGTVIALGKQTETQAGSMDFGSRMTFANSILENTEQLGTNLGEQFFSKIPIFGGALTSPEFKQYDQARRTFVNAILRRESGAAIAESEFESANQQYFPQPFDTPEVIAQKRAARELATTMMLAASGPNATQYAKDQAAQFAKQLNPLFGTEEYNKQREELKKNTSSTTTAGGNERLNF